MPHTETPVARAALQGLVVLFAAFAASPTRSDTLAEAQALHRRERAVCTSGTSPQPRDTCLREADAAFDEALRGGLSQHKAATYLRNALLRCIPLPEADRRDCEARMQGKGTQTGTVSSGGIYRELVTRVPAASAPKPPASAGTPGQ